MPENIQTIVPYSDCSTVVSVLELQYGRVLGLQYARVLESQYSEFFSFIRAEILKKIFKENI
ncbi:hypothetical protein CVN76_07235 [Bacillus sp. mrc49]|nr:hypothetical protein CVN76_07235 [Bacillus sp. mrc49]